MDDYFAQDDRLILYTDAGPIARWNDMGDILRPFPAKYDEEEDYKDAENV